MNVNLKMWTLNALVILGMTTTLFGYDIKNKALSPVSFKENPDHEALPMIKDGELQFAIAYDHNSEKKLRYKDRKSIENAVLLLQEALKKCVGKEAPVIDANDPAAVNQYKYLILLGKSKLTDKLGMTPMKLPKEGFEIKTFPGGVAIAGYDSSLIDGYNKDPLDMKGPLRGTLWGAYDFIERFMGCRFFYPGKFGSIWPKIDNLTIAPANYTDYPRFANRDSCWVVWTMMGENNKKRWAPLIGDYNWPMKTPFYERWRLVRTTPFHAGHSPNPEAFFKAHPDKKETIFYKAPNGNLYFNAHQHIGNYFDVTNLAFADLLVESLKKYYASNGKEKYGWGKTSSPNNSYINFGQCDTGVPLPDMINNPVVKKYNLITPENIKRGDPYSDIYGRFYQYLGNRLKKEIPGKRLVLLPYSQYTKAPLNPKWNLPDNIELRVCVYGFPAYTRNPEIVAKWVKLLREWYKALGNRPAVSLWLYNVPNNCFARAIAPYFVGESATVLGKYLGRDSMFFDQYGDLEWYYYYSNYAASRCMWNPDFDAKAAIEEHWVPFYGNAAPYLKEFHALLLDSYLTYFVTDGKDKQVLYPAPVINKLDNLLEKARKSLKPDSIEMKRFKLFAAPWAKALEKQRNRMNYERPVYGVHRLLSTEKININGKLDESVWSSVKAMPLRDPKGSNDKLKYPPLVKLAWDKQGIYGICKMSFPPLADKAKSIWENSNIEIFVSPGSQKADMYHFAVDSMAKLHLGTKQFVPVDKPYNGYWACPGFKYAVNASPEGWTLEYFIPFESLKVRAPSVYDCWYFNIVRNKNSEQKEYSGSAMTLGNNHNVGMFGLIKFLGKGD